MRKAAMKVFISSTYKDLIDYRAAAIRAVEGTNYQASKMEVFGARPDEPLEACLKEVEESDLFIGLYAHRYGYVPAGKEISITEMEYLHAKDLNKSIYCFVIDEENQPWLPKFMEGEPGASKLKDFKGRVQANHVCAFFTTAQDLGMRVANALSHFVANNLPAVDYRIPVPEHRKPKGSTLPNQPYFFGRESELALITDAISPESRTWGVLIDGPGGIGKTALAVEAAHQAPKENFDHKFFITAKVRELTPSGEKPLTDFTRPSYLEMLNELAIDLGEDEIPRLAPDERTKQLWNALRGKKVLVVFDNLETLHEDERTRLFQFLTRLPEGNKSIVTSRRRSEVDARIIRLDRLSANEALQLIVELAKNNPRLARESEKARRDLYEMTNGNPLLIKWVCGQLGRDGSALHTIEDSCKFIDNAPDGNDPLEYIFGDLLDTFTPSETKVLAALTHFTELAKQEWIAVISGLSERATQTALEDLCDRSILISNGEAQEFMLPLLAVKFIRDRRPEVVKESSDRLVDHVYALVMQYGGDTNYEGYKNLEKSWSSIAASFLLLAEINNRRLQSIRKNMAKFLEFSGHWDEFLWLNQVAEEKALITNDINSAGWSVFSIGWVHYLRGEGEKVLESARRLETYAQNTHGSLKAAASRLHGLGEYLVKKYSEAIIAYDHALAIQRTIDSTSRETASILYDAAEAKCCMKKYESAESDLREALLIAQKLDNKEGIATYTNGLAELALGQEKWKQSEELSREALALSESIGYQELIAANCLRIAKCLSRLNQPSDGLPFAQRAVLIFRRLRYRELPYALEILAECEAVS
jgi:tetratricopeptide (TPR) repeat protein